VKQKADAKTESAEAVPAPVADAARAVDEQLDRYRAMRDFSATAEPSGGHGDGASAASALPFVIQKHAATRLHYDFRLGWRGVLKSWACAKGPSYVTRDRRLAVQVEDHPMEYGGFEGTIPKGQYGGGTVLLWDQGTWEPHGDVDEGLARGSLKFTLDGQKMRGRWTLVRMSGRAAGESKPNWLLIKEHDEFEQHEGDPPITESAPDSVVTGRSLAQIAEAEDHTWNSNRPETGTKTKAPANRSRLSRANLHSTIRPRPPEPEPAPSPARKSAGQPEKKAVPANAAATDHAAEVPAALDRAPLEDLPRFLAPQLASASHGTPPGSDWLYELKLDGYRVQIHIEEKSVASKTAPAVTIYTRNGLDWTHRMTGVAKAAAAFAKKNRVQAAVLDGEVVVLNDTGGTSFADLQAAFDEGARHPLTCFVFDLLHLNLVDHSDGSGHNLRSVPLRERKTLLQDLLREGESDALRYCEHVEATENQPAPAIVAEACAMGAEGIIAKLGSSLYTGGRSSHWLKLKCVRRQEFVIGGFTLPGDRGEGLGSLLLGYYAGGKLVHCGRTGTGFTQSTQRMLRKKLEALRAEKSPYGKTLTGLARKDAIWVLPELVCEVEFATWTSDGLVRHASFQGLREDKDPRDVVKEDTAPAVKPRRGRVAEDSEPEAEGESELIAAEVPAPTAAANSEPQPPDPRKTASKRLAHSPDPHAARKVSAAAPARPSPPAKNNAPEIVAGARLTHPDKILDESTGVTKRQLALYYEAIAPAMLPHIEGRPLSIVRCPDGSTRPCFFQKHAGQGLPPAVESTTVPDKKTGKPEEYITVATTGALVSLAQLGVLEVHPWGSRNGALEEPDRLIFDLDPDEALPWPRLVESARSIRSFLQELELESFVKTTGGKGLHLVVPIAPTIEWPRIKLFCRGVAAAIESSDPKLYLIKMTKAARKGRIFLDYLRNERGATAVAPYSPRARFGMRAAVPLDWDELDHGMPTFAIANFDAWRPRLKHDPWSAMLKSRQTIRPEVLDSVLALGAK
jgi:bifunctional non-homologous end joining protein LigD